MMDKKGVAGWFMGIFPQLMIAVAFLVLLGLILSPFIMKQLSPETSDQAAKRNFDNLANNMEELRESYKDFQTTLVFYQLEKSHYLVGFHSGEDTVPVDSRLATRDWVVNKPSVCFDDACLCLYEDKPSKSEEEKDEGVVTCRIFPGNVKFFGYLGDGNVMEKGANTRAQIPPDDLKFEYLFLGTGMEISEMQKNNLKYAEIIRHGGDFSLEVVQGENSDWIIFSPAVSVMREHQKTFEICPDNSPDKCDGKPYGYAYRNETQEKDFGCIYVEDAGRCVLEEIEEHCDPFQNSEERCICKDETSERKVMELGKVCAFGEIYDVNCRDVYSCEDYCEGECDDFEEMHCEKDPCNVKNCVFDDKRGRVCTIT